MKRSRFTELRLPLRCSRQWRQHYNTVRPHAALGYRPPTPGAYTPVRNPRPKPSDCKGCPVRLTCTTARGLKTIVRSPYEDSNPLEWTSNGPGSNLEGGTTREGRSRVGTRSRNFI